MQWQHIVSYLFAGMFLANSLPHLVSGVQGHAFTTPFASPPGQGMSCPEVNVAWGMANLLVAYLMGLRVGSFNHRKLAHLLPLSLGFGVMNFVSAHYFASVHP